MKLFKKHCFSLFVALIIILSVSNICFAADTYFDFEQYAQNINTSTFGWNPAGAVPTSTVQLDPTNSLNKAMKLSRGVSTLNTGAWTEKTITPVAGKFSVKWKMYFSDTASFKQLLLFGKDSGGTGKSFNIGFNSNGSFYTEGTTLSKTLSQDTWYSFEAYFDLNDGSYGSVYILCDNELLTKSTDANIKKFYLTTSDNITSVTSIRYSINKANDTSISSMYVDNVNVQQILNYSMNFESVPVNTVGNDPRIGFTPSGHYGDYKVVAGGAGSSAQSIYLQKGVGSVQAGFAKTISKIAGNNIAIEYKAKTSIAKSKQFQCLMDSTNAITFNYSVDTAGTCSVNGTATTISGYNDGSWHTYKFVIDNSAGTKGKVNFYYDGVLKLSNIDLNNKVSYVNKLNFVVAGADSVPYNDMYLDDITVGSSGAVAISGVTFNETSTTNYISPLPKTKINSGVNATALITNSTVSSTSPTAIFAYYEDGQLKSVQTENLTINPSSTSVISKSILGSGSFTAAKIKVMLFNNLTNIMPLCEASETNITNLVSFNTNGGSTVVSQTVNSGSTAIQPTAPTKTGSTFVGWYSDGALTSTFNFSTPITVDTTVYAKWN